MAIIPDVPHVAVDIIVDGKPLPEYLDEDDGKAVSSNSITKYVECKSGSNFAIRTDTTGLGIQHLQGGDSLDVDYFIDGQKVSGLVFRYPWTSVYTHRAARSSEGGIWKERDFRFADIVTSMLTLGWTARVLADAPCSRGPDIPHTKSQASELGCNHRRLLSCSSWSSTSCYPWQALGCPCRTRKDP